MSLDALLEPMPERNMTRPCKIGQFHLGLEEPYKTALTNLLETSYQDGGMSDEHVTSRLSQAGLKVGATLVNRHRRRLCSCGDRSAE